MDPTDASASKMGKCLHPPRPYPQTRNAQIVRVTVMKVLPLGSRHMRPCYNFSLGCFLFATLVKSAHCALTTESTCPCPLNAKVKVTFCQFKNSNAEFLFKKSRFVIVNNRRKIGSITHTGNPVKD